MADHAVKSPCASCDFHAWQVEHIGGKKLKGKEFDICIECPKRLKYLAFLAETDGVPTTTHEDTYHAVERPQERHIIDRGWANSKPTLREIKCQTKHGKNSSE